MKWELLPLADRARYMAAAVRNGYTDIRAIKEAYANFDRERLSAGNRYNDGGEFEVINPLDEVFVDYDTEDTGYIPWFIQNTEHASDNPMTNQQYYSLMEKVATENNPIWNTYRKEEGLPELTVDEEYTRILNDNSYDYRGYYNDPAVRNSNDNANTHWPDEYKTAYHPTFSTYSLYSGMIDPNYNPTGKNGGLWFGDNYVNYNQNAYGGNLLNKGGNKRSTSNVGGVQGFLNLLDKKGIRYTKTSDYRKGAMTKSGHPSWHSQKDQWGNSKAADIWFTDFDKAKKSIYSDPELVAYLMDNKLGILEETTDDVKKRTGATLGPNRGNHFHIGPDRWAVSMRDNAIRQFGTTYHPMQDVTWEDVQARRRRTELTPEEEALLNTSALKTLNPEYVDRNGPDYRSALADAVALDESLYKNDNPANNWAKFQLISSMQQNTSQDPANWMSVLASSGSTSLPRQNDNTDSTNWLFTPMYNESGDGGFLYHGLNFAAYGGKAFPYGGYTNALNAINSTGEGFHYVIDGLRMNRQLALDYINNHKNETYAVNRYATTSSTAGKQKEEQNWQTLDANGNWIDNNEYHPEEGNLDEVIVTHPYTINRSLPQDITRLQQSPVTNLNVTAPIDLTNTEQNMFHRRDVANADAYVREALSSDVTDNIYDYMMPSTWAGLADKALEGGYSFNQLFNPTYDNQGFVGLVGADEWADEHPEATALINTGVDFALPFGIKGIKIAANKMATAHPGIVQYPRYWYGKTIKYRGAELPTIYRKIKGNSISTDTENVIFTNNPSRFRVVETGLDPLITNFTTDMPVLSHGEGNWDIADTYAIPGNSLLGKRVISTRPSDTFTIKDIVKIPKKKVTLITGDPQSITAAQNSGIGKIVSTDRLKEALIRDIVDNNAANAGSRFRFHKDDFSRYARMMRNEARANFRAPTLKDYLFMDYVFRPEFTSDVMPLSMRNTYMKFPQIAPDWFINSASNSSTRPLLNELDNLLYQPATEAEAQWRRANGIEELKDIPLIIQRRWNN